MYRNSELRSSGPIAFELADTCYDLVSHCEPGANGFCFTNATRQYPGFTFSLMHFPLLPAVDIQNIPQLNTTSHPLSHLFQNYQKSWFESSITTHEFTDWYSNATLHPVSRFNNPSLVEYDNKPILRTCAYFVLTKVFVSPKNSIGLHSRT